MPAQASTSSLASAPKYCSCPEPRPSSLAPARQLNGSAQSSLAVPGHRKLTTQKWSQTCELLLRARMVAAAPRSTATSTISAIKRTAAKPLPETASWSASTTTTSASTAKAGSSSFTPTAAPKPAAPTARKSSTATPRSGGGMTVTAGSPAAGADGRLDPRELPRWVPGGAGPAQVARRRARSTMSWTWCAEAAPAGRGRFSLSSMSQSGEPSSAAAKSSAHM